MAKALKDSIDYMENPLKTDNGELISSYECDARTVDSEFLLSKQRYASITGRDQGQNNVIAYHVRQSFLPGEITPEEANRIGYELAMRFTKGQYAFIVCTHTDRAHIHNHIVWNSTALDCKKKFRNFIGSAFALRGVNDLLCAENGLSVVKNPKTNQGKDYGKWLGENKPPSFQDRLRKAIDAALEQKPKTFEEFLTLMRASGCTVMDSGKYLKFLAPSADGLPDQKKPTRCDTLRGDYTEDAIRERIAGRRSSAPINRSVVKNEQKVSLLIDIQAKIRDGKGAGYERWAKVHNLKQMAQTLIYLQDKGLDDYAVLKEKTSTATVRFNELSESIKKLETELTANANLQKQIVTYSKTHAIYVEYRKAGYSKKFKELHETDILLHQTAKKAFDTLGVKKLPTVASLRSEYALVLEEKKKAYRDYQQIKKDMHELLIAKNNVDRLLNITDVSQNTKQKERTIDPIAEQK